MFALILNVSGITFQERRDGNLQTAFDIAETTSYFCMINIPH